MKLFFISLLLVFFSVGLQAQNFLNSKDLRAFKSDALTETDISQIQKDLQSKGVTIDQFQDQVVEKGMPIAEFNKLKIRLSNSISAADKNISPLLQFDKKKKELNLNKKKIRNIKRFLNRKLSRTNKKIRKKLKIN